MKPYEQLTVRGQARRMLWVANYVARFQREHLEGHLEWLAQKFECLLETGEIRKF